MSLIIDTGRLRQKPEPIRGEEPASSLDIEEEGVIRPEGALAYNLTAQCVSGELIVHGSLKINITCPCSRCGDNFTRKIFVPDFVRNFPLTSKNELINLTPDVREDILLALPIVAVCSAGCRGLCSGCGINLNRKSCECKKPEKKNVWEALDSLRLKSEKTGKIIS